MGLGTSSTVINNIAVVCKLMAIIALAAAVVTLHARKMTANTLSPQQS
jgi:hypothetical protein